MFVNFEFLDEEPIENVITCLNYRMDKVVFFGFPETIQKRQNMTDSFLRKYCGVQSVDFVPLSRMNFQSTLTVMRSTIELYKSHKDHLFFDITGGESMILVAFGMLAKEFQVSIHQYLVEKNELIELDQDNPNRLSSCAQRKTVRLNLNKYIEMQGGKINSNLQKESKEFVDSSFKNDIETLFKISSQYKQYWNPFTAYFASIPKSGTNELFYAQRQSQIESMLRKTKTALNSLSVWNHILDDLFANGMIRAYVHQNGFYSFYYKNEMVMNCLKESGCTLELHTFLQQVENSDDCMVGVHLDWGWCYT